MSPGCGGEGEGEVEIVRCSEAEAELVTVRDTGAARTMGDFTLLRKVLPHIIKFPQSTRDSGP